MKLFRGRYRSDTKRFHGFDYTAVGSYFVTINTKGRTCWFGDVRDGRMILNDIGDIVAEEWMKTPLVRSKVTLDQWQIMPDHMHGIIVLHESESEASSGRIPFVDFSLYWSATTRRVEIDFRPRSSGLRAEEGRSP